MIITGESALRGLPPPQAQFAKKEDLTLKVIGKSFDAAPVLILGPRLNNRSHLLLMRQLIRSNAHCARSS
jgi:hypothetical protein